MSKLPSPSPRPVLSGSIARFTILAAAATVLLPVAAHAQSGSWSGLASGNWSTTTNWVGAVVADGADNTADFSAIDLVNDLTVHLDTPRTIGSLIFGDADTASAGGWLLDNNGVSTNVLTIQSASSTITVNTLGTGKSATISAEVAGGDINKSGDGNLILSGANTFNGNLNINAGSVTINGANPAAKALFMRGVSSLTINSGGSLTTTNNYSSMGVAAGDVATVTVKGTGSFTAGDADFNVSDVNGSQGTLTVQDNATVSVAGTFFVSKNQNTTGTLNLSGGTITAARNFVLGQGTASNGIASITGGSLSVNGETWIGNDPGGSAHLTQSGGAVSGNNWFVVGRFGSTGVYDMSGGTLTKTGDGRFIIGDGGGSNGTLNLSGTALVDLAAELWVGQNTGVGKLSVTGGGSLTANNWIAVGRENGSGTVTLSDNGVIKKTGGNGSHIIIGSLGGTGVVNQTGGQMFTEGGGDIRLGEARDGTTEGSGIWNISGGTASAEGLRIGWAGKPGTVSVSGTGSVTLSSANADAAVVTVSESAGDGTLSVSGNGSVTADHFDIGRGIGKGVVNQSGGTITASRWIAVGLATGSPQTAEFNLSGGTTNAAGFEVGADSAGLVTLSGTGVLNARDVIEVPTRNGSGTFNITGGTLNTASFQQGGRDGNVGTGVTNQSGGLVNVTGNLDVERLNVGSGAYNLSGGSLSVDGSINLNGGTFAFTGGEITRSNPGTITFNGDLTTGNGLAAFDLDNDKTFDINGALNINAGLTLELTGITIPAWDGAGVDTGSFTLGSVDSIVGLFGPSTNTLLGLTIDNQFNTTFISETAGEGGLFDPNSQSVYWIQETGGVVTLEYSVVPEPSSASLLALAGLALGIRRRRK